MTVNKLPVLTTSATKTFRACPRLYRYQYVDGYRSVHVSEAMSFGTLIHKALEVFWQTGDVVVPAQEDEFAYRRALAVMLGYETMWGRPEGVLGVEVEYTMDLVNPASGSASRTWRHGGKIDAIIPVPGWVVEHKTTTEDIGAGSPYWRRLRLDNQVSNYMAGARSLGYEVRSCLYDIIRRPALRPLLATPVESRKFTKDGALYANQRAVDETPEEFFDRLCADIAERPGYYYARGEVVRLEGEEEDAAFDLWQTARVIREAELAGRWPRNPDACMRYSRECEFFGVCTGEASLEDETLFVKKVQINEELQCKS